MNTLLTTPEERTRTPRTCEFSRGMVGSAGTCQPAAAARRSQARRRARPAYDAGVHLRPRLGPANSPSAARVRGRRAMAEEVAVRQPDDGQAAADDARPRPPEDAAPAAVHVVHEDPQRLVLAPRPHPGAGGHFQRTTR
jgi:hypothetical protein